MAQASMFIPPDPQFFDDTGNPLAGGLVYFYQPAFGAAKAVYSDSAGMVALSNPVVLDSSGRAKIWLDGYYSVILKNSLGITIWSEDNVSSAYSSAAVVPPVFSEWQLQSFVLTFIGATQFSVPGDQTAVYSVGRRIKATVTAGTITGTITVSTLAAEITTVTVLWDLSQALDAGLSATWTGIISPIASGTPYQLPIGSIIDWYKSMVGVPALCYGWVECNGQTLSDALSPMNGQVIPNLNGNAGGADTFGNGKAAVYLRGGTISGIYSNDQIKAHPHGVSSVTVNAHTHTTTITTGNPSATHTHTVVNTANNDTNVASGGGTGQILQVLTTATSSTESAPHTHTGTGTSGNASANGLTGVTDDNGAASETVPKTVRAVKIMRVK